MPCLYIREIQQLNQEIEQISADVQETRGKFDLRNKQFQLFLHSLHQLSQILDEEEQPPKVAQPNSSQTPSSGTNLAEQQNNSSNPMDGKMEDAAMIDVTN
jgi:hypothetical protein